jgi:DNA polymerase-3 subunit beta
MQLVVSKRELVRLLSRCQSVADKKSTMPVLANVLLEAVGSDKLKLAATDLYVAVSGTVGAEIEKGGSIAIGARDLYERVKMMPEGKIGISTTEATTTIRAFGQARRYTLHGIAGQEFPSLPEPSKSAESMSLSPTVLGKLIAATHFSISTDETRLHLSSALFEWEGDKVRVVTTDGHRLSKMEVKVPGKQASATMLIPLKGVLELKRLCDEAKTDGAADAEIAIRQSGPNAFFDMPGFQFSVKLVDAQFPPYQQVIPASSRHQVAVPRLALSEALRAVSIAASERTGGVKVSFSKNLLRLSSESPESGDGFDEIPVEYGGADLSVGFNAKYLLDVLASIESEEVLLGVSGELDPAVVVPKTQSKDTEYLAVVMPMRI